MEIMRITCHDSKARCGRPICTFHRKTRRESFIEWKSNEHESSRRSQRSRNVSELESTEDTKELRSRKWCYWHSQSQELGSQQKLYSNYRKEREVSFRWWSSSLQPKH